MYCKIYIKYRGAWQTAMFIGIRREMDKTPKLKIWKIKIRYSRPCTPMKFTPVRCTSIRYIHAYKMHACKIHACEMHAVRCTSVKCMSLKYTYVCKILRIGYTVFAVSAWSDYRSIVSQGGQCCFALPNRRGWIPPPHSLMFWRCPWTRTLL